MGFVQAGSRHWKKAIMSLVCVAQRSVGRDGFLLARTVQALAFYQPMRLAAVQPAAKVSLCAAVRVDPRDA
jgi:hypothetical protein